MSNRLRFRPAVERLEEIIAPALTAHLRGHTLLITDTPRDTAAAQVTISAVETGQVSVQIGDAEEGQLFTAVRNIRINLRNRAVEGDEVNIGSLNLPGNLIINTGRGDDNVTIAGEEGARIGGNLIANLGVGNDTFSLEGYTIGGNLRVNGGAGDNSVSAKGSARNASYTGGRGTDALDVSGLNVLQRVNVQLRGGDDSLTFDGDTSVGAGGEINGGRGENTLSGEFSSELAALVDARHLRIIHFVEDGNGGD